ncbi:hypothetical protein [Lewinella sp. LCG006]|uniref:hypothetical protein n=1 Tax=Lewinella sp. LCG006 TaxID=3231911 RepID=UPI003460F742
MKYELSHDTIARQVFEKASIEARTRRKVERFVRERHEAWQQRGARLTQDDLDYIGPYLGQINLTKEEDQFIVMGRKELVRQGRRRRLLITSIIAILALTTIAAIFQSRAAERERLTAEEARQDADKKAIALALNEQALQASLLEAKIANDTARIRRIEAEIATEKAKISALIANRAQRSAEQRALETKILGVVNVARSLPLEQRDLALRLAQVANEMPGASSLPQAAEVLTDLFYQQIASGKGTGNPLYQYVFTHDDVVNSVRFSPDGSKVLTSDRDGWVKLWDRSSGSLLVSRNLASSVNFVEFSPDGSRILATTYSKTVHWQLNDADVSSLPDVNEPLLRAMFSRDGQSVLQIGQQKIMLTDLAGEVRCLIEEHGESITFGCFGPDEQNIWVGYKDGTIKCFSANDGSLQRSWHKHNSFIHWLVFAPDGNRFIALEDRGAAKIWSLDGELLYKVPNGAKFATWSPDGKYLSTGTISGTLQLWQKDSVLVFSKQAHEEYIRYLDFSADGQLLLTVSGDGLAKIWDLKGQLKQVLRGHTKDLRTARFSPDGKFVVTGSVDFTARLWPLDGVLLQRIGGDETKWFSLVNYLPNHDYLLTQKYGNLSLWNREEECLARLGTSEGSSMVKEGRDLIAINQKGGLALLNGNGTKIKDISAGDADQRFVGIEFIKGGQTLVTVAKQGLVQEWDGKGELVQEFNINEQNLRLTALAPKRQILCLAGYQENVWMYNLAGKRLAHLAHGNNYNVTAIAFSADEQEVYLSYQDQIIRRWSTDGRLLAEWKYAGSWADYLVPISSGKAIITNGIDEGLAIWSKEGKLLQVLPHPSAVQSFKLSPDGKLLLSFTAEGTSLSGIFHLWDMERKQKIYQWGDQINKYDNAFFSADGRRVITVSEDDFIDYWPLVDEVYNYLKNEAAIPQLTPEQRKLYGID